MNSPVGENPGWPLVLASASPRRRRILKDAGYAFEALDPGDVEAFVQEASHPDALALAKARAKAAVAVSLWKGSPCVVIGADTLVARGDEIMGKPEDCADAIRILKRLSGTRHRVITGVCLWPTKAGTEPIEFAETSWVVMRVMGIGEIEAYVASGEADGKAGAYAVQETGDRFVERIEGSMLNVVGFPLERFQALLSRAWVEWGVV